MSQPVLEPQQINSIKGSDGWMVVIFNNDTNSMEEVVFILMTATDCSEEEAEIETWEADHYGKAAVHYASKDECDRIAEVIRTIGVRSDVVLVWPEE